MTECKIEGSAAHPDLCAEPAIRLQSIRLGCDCGSGPQDIRLHAFIVLLSTFTPRQTTMNQQPRLLLSPQPLPAPLQMSSLTE
jgi:hypothetical protein